MGFLRRFREGLTEEIDRPGKLLQRQKEQDSQTLFLELLDRGATPDVAEQVSAGFLKTGQISVPEFQTKQLESLPDVPERSTRVPTKIGKRKALYTWDKGTGKFNEQPIGDDVDEITVKEYDSSPKNDGFNIYVNTRTGQEIRREPNGSRQDKVIKVGSTSSSGSGKDRPDVALAKKFLSDLQKDIDLGMPIDPERMETAKTASEVVGNVEVEQGPEEVQTTEPGKIAKFFGAEPKTTVIPGKAKVKYGDKPKETPPPVNKAEMEAEIARAKKAIAKGLVSREDALRRLTKQYGNQLPRL